MKCDLCDEHVDPDDIPNHREEHRLAGEGVIDEHGCEIFDVPGCLAKLGPLERDEVNGLIEEAQDDLEGVLFKLVSRREDALQLLMESRECIAACFRAIASSDDKMIMDRLEINLGLSGVKYGIGVRIQNFVRSVREERDRLEDFK